MVSTSLKIYFGAHQRKRRAYNSKERQALPEGSIDGGTGALKASNNTSVFLSFASREKTLGLQAPQADVSFLVKSLRDALSDHLPSRGLVDRADLVSQGASKAREACAIGPLCRFP